MLRSIANLLRYTHGPFDRGQSHRRHLVAICASLTCLSGISLADNVPVSITLEDSAKWHVHLPHQKFAVNLKADFGASGALQYHWTNYAGTPLSSPVPLTGGRLERIESPMDTVGYYGLVLSSPDQRTTLPNRQTHENLEFGFAILPEPATARASLAARFGIVHGDKADPYMPVWLKTLTWETAGHQLWGWEIQQRLSLGKLELPNLSQEFWVTDDSRPITSSELEALKQRAKLYFAASEIQPYWETGVEENLQPRYRARYYWQNLASKAQSLKAAAQEVNRSVKLVYQVANLTPQQVDEFLGSDAAKAYDVLALHPYAWPDFNTPEMWLEDFMATVRRSAEQHAWNKPLWFTEVGAPHFGNVTGGFFGYPQSATPTGGLTRTEAAIYVCKMNVMAAQLGVDKQFWYNYRDAGSERDYAESHFGLRDYWGYLKPAYVAYAHLTGLLEQKAPVGARQLPNNVRLYEFRGVNADVIVAWTYPPRTVRVSLDAIRTGLTPADIIQVTDVAGTPQAQPIGSSLFLRTQPHYLVVNSGH